MESSVASIIKRVKDEGDAALSYYTKMFDNSDVQSDFLRVKKENLQNALNSLEPEL